MFVARDKDKELGLYTVKPVRDGNYGNDFAEDEFWNLPGDDGDYSTLPQNLFPDLSWEDDPVEVKILGNSQLDEIITEALRLTGISEERQVEIFAHLVTHNYFL